MKKMNKLAALIMTFIMLASATAAFAGTYVSDPVSPAISDASDGEDQGTSDPTAVAPATEPSVAPEATPVPDTGASETDAVVKTDQENGSVNIRAAASLDAEILGQLTSDAHVTVIGTEGDWSKIRTDGITGYIYSKYLVVSVPETTPVPEETEVPEETPVPVAVERKVSIRTTLGDVVNAGDTITMTAELTGFDGVNVELQWQQNAGAGWRDVNGATGQTFSYIATEETINSRWRVAVTIVG